MKYTESSAVISECGLYRYELVRGWGEPLDPVKTIVFIGLNPSTADSEEDDPTIQRCVGFAKTWGFARLVMVNLFAYRATSPKVLKRKKRSIIIGKFNDECIHMHATRADCIVAAWGTNGCLIKRDLDVCILLQEAGVSLKCLGETAKGSPRHPLYLEKTTTLKDFILKADRRTVIARGGKLSKFAGQTKTS